MRFASVMSPKAGPMVALTAVLAAFFSSADASARSHEGQAPSELRSEKFQTGDHPVIAVDNLYGAVEVVAGDPAQVTVEARISGAREGAAGKFRVEISESAAGIRARATCLGKGERFAWCGKQRVDFVLHVPLLASLELRGVGTDLRVVGVHGELSLSTMSGSIDIRDAGVVRAESASGSVRIDGAEAADITAADGDVELLRMREGTARFHRASEGDEAQAQAAPRDERSLVVRGAETLLRKLLVAIHTRSIGSCTGDC